MLAYYGFKLIKIVSDISKKIQGKNIKNTKFIILCTILVVCSMLRNILFTYFILSDLGFVSWSKVYR